MNKQTLGVRLWALKNVFLLWLASPTVLEVNERRCVVRIPLNWKTKNHLGSMYFGALCIGADVSGGLIAFHLMQQQKVKLSFVFKDVKASFLKRPEDDVIFTCEDGASIQDTFNRAIATGERQESTVHIVATCPRKLGEEPVATFELTLSLKKK
jgi:acyl-coenzyme A thioesterase PaaI-like protein